MAGAAVDGKQVDAPYWESLRGGALTIQQCDCGAWQWPAVHRCEACGKWDPPWRETPMRGTVYSWTRTHQAFPGLEVFGLPFVSVLVELEDAGGVRLVGILDGSDEGLAIGKPVTGTIVERVMQDQTMPSIVWHL